MEERGDFFSGYTYVPILEKIEGLRSLDEIQKEQEEKPQTTIRGGDKKNKLTPDKLKEREEFLKKFGI